MNSLKAHVPGASSDAIVVSFDARWIEALRASAVSLVFRKRGPRALIPRWIYVYVGSPHSLILGRFPIHRYEQLPVDDALKRADEAGLSREELTQYLTDYDSVATFSVGALEPAPCPRPLAQLQSAYSFSPPQSFLVLSKDGQRTLDASLGFSKHRSGRKS